MVCKYPYSMYKVPIIITPVVLKSEYALQLNTIIVITEMAIDANDHLNSESIALFLWSWKERIKIETELLESTIKNKN